jgi:hypothetical protein
MILLFLSCGKADENPDNTTDSTDTGYHTILQVGADKEFKTIREASLAAHDSTLIEVDAGTYSGDVTAWSQNHIYIRAVGGEVVLDANGQYWDGKGIWEVKEGSLKVSGITFRNARVPDNNGAGIRFTKGKLTVENCKFLYNENGILTGNQGGTLIIRHTEFGYMGYGDGYSHNIYVGRIDTLKMSGCYSHHSRTGHLLKCRAKFSVVANNRLTNENDNTYNASYEMDFPDGGTHIVVGNIVQQSIQSPNPAIIAFAEENNTIWSENKLYLSHNTILNSKTTTNPLLLSSAKTPAGSIVMVNNLLSDNTASPAASLLALDKGNEKYSKTELNESYVPSSALYESLKSKIEPGIDQYLPASLRTAGVTLIPSAEYVHPCTTAPLTGAPAIAGALQQHY